MMTTPNHARAAAGLEPAPALYVFTGDTYVKTARRERYGDSGIKNSHSPAVTVTVLAADQADAERIAGAMLSTPDDTPEGAYGSHIDRHTRHFTWSSVEQAPAGTAEAEQLRQELAQTVADLDEARSTLRVSERQASDEREHASNITNGIARVRALHIPAGKPAVCVHCTTAGGNQHPYPCPTIRALEGDA